MLLLLSLVTLAASIATPSFERTRPAVRAQRIDGASFLNRGGASTPDSLAHLILARFVAGSPEAFDSVYPDPAGREVLRNAIRRKAERTGEIGQVLWNGSDRAVLLLSATVSGPTGAAESFAARNFSGLYEAARQGGQWTLGSKIPIDTANFVRQQTLHVELDPRTGIQVVDTAIVSVGSPYGFITRLNNRIVLRSVEVDGRPASHSMGGGILRIGVSPRERATLVLRYTLAPNPLRDSTAHDASGLPVYGSFANTDLWYPTFDFTSGHEFAPTTVTVRLPAVYRLTTTLPQTESVHDGIRTVVGHSTAPVMIAALLYNQTWRVETSEFDGVQFETFLTPDYRVSHDSLQRTAQRVYRLLDRRFGVPASQTHYLAVVEMEEAGPTGFSVHMNNAVVTGHGVRAVADTIIAPSAGFAHEISHAWTTRATGPGGAFLREGWARFAESTLFRDEYGPRTATEFWEKLRASYMAEANGRISMLGHPDNNDIHYTKGGWILHMLNTILGDSVFDRGMRAYIARRDIPQGYQEFIADMSHAAGRDLTSFVMPWLTSRYIPDVNAHIDGTQLIVTQVQDGPLFDLLLDIELTTAAGSVHRSVHLTGRSDTVSVAGVGAIRKVTVDPEHHLLLERHLGEMVHFSIHAPDAKDVAIFGSFTPEPIPATRNGDEWMVDVPVTEGRYYWAWRVDGRTADFRDLAHLDPKMIGVLTVRPIEPVPAPAH